MNTMHRSVLGPPLLLSLCLMVAPVGAQTTYPYPNARTRRSANSRTGGATAENRGLAGTFQGTLKSLSKKEIVIVNSEDQEVVIRVSRKTKYWKQGKEVKPATIEAGALVAVDATEDIDMKPIAAAVRVETLTPKEKSGERK